MLSQPFLISAMLIHIQTSELHSSWDDYKMFAAFASNFAGSAIFASWYAHNVTRFRVVVRSVLISALFDKALHGRAQDVDVGSATVLMNVDLEKILDGVGFVHEIWIVPIGLVACFYLLFENLGRHVVVPLLVTILAAALTLDIGETMTSRNLKWVTATEKRVMAISKLASSLKEVRMLGLAETLHQIVVALRIDELTAYR